jgi:hypothetical protein
MPKVGQIIVFTSHRKGVGRTMTAANLAWMLASAGSRVIALDWNFDAPRLAEYFHPFWPESDPRMETGIIDILWKYVLDQLRATDSAIAPAEPTLLERAIPLCWRFPSRGRLDLVGVGLPRSYKIRTALFPFEAFFEELGGQFFVDRVCSLLRENYDYTVVDAPPLQEDRGGICTCRLADTLVLCFTLFGNEALVTAQAAVQIKQMQSRLSPDRHLQIVPVIMRSETAEAESRMKAWKLAKSAFAPLTSDGSSVELDLEVPFIAFYQYQQSLAIFSDSSELGMYGAYKRILRVLTDGQALHPVAPRDEEKRAVMSKYETPTRPLPAAREGSPFDPNQRMQPSSVRSGHFFVSYVRQEFDRIALTLDQIQQMGHDVWWDTGIDPGSPWKDTLREKIEQSRGVILFATRRALDSDWVQWELREAHKAGKRILPIKLDDMDLSLAMQRATDVGALLAEHQYIADPGIYPSPALELALRRMRG